jgi:hypothetical protein
MGIPLYLVYLESLFSGQRGKEPWLDAGGTRGQAPQCFRALRRHLCTPCAHVVGAFPAVA